jgi:hypothetical protein
VISRGTASSSTTRQSHATLCAISSASVSPAEAIAGLLKVTRGSAA